MQTRICAPSWLVMFNDAHRESRACLVNPNMYDISRFAVRAADAIFYANVFTRNNPDALRVTEEALALITLREQALSKLARF